MRRLTARVLRKNMTGAEGVLWRRLRARRLRGFKFRRQFPIGPYFADFCCLEQRLIVEIDGDQHTDNTAYDNDRTAYLRSLGFRVLRFSNEATLNTPAVVCSMISSALDPRS